MRMAFYSLCLGVFASLSVYAMEPARVVLPENAITAPAPASDAYSITPDDVTTSIAVALKQAGAGENLDVRLVGSNRDAVYTYDTPITMQVSDIAFDRRAGSWKATLLFESEGVALSPAQVSGRFDEAAMIPVLKRRLYTNDVVEADDIEMKRIAQSRLRKDVITRKEDLIGMTPIKTISEGRPIRVNEISHASVVRKGAQVHMKFLAGNLSINTLCEALDAGELGDTTRVTNLTSNTVVHAEIIEKDVVQVKTFETIQASKEP